jgi:hypothetical protein
MIRSEDARNLSGATVLSPEGEKIGTAGQVYVDAQNGLPTWVTIHTGLFGRSESFVPLENASMDGEALRVPYDKDVIKDAPRVDPDEPLSPEQERSLYAHYDVSDENNDDDEDVYAAPEAGAEGDRGAEREDVDGSAAAAAGPVPVPGARLRKFVVTEYQTVTVPVTHEELRVEPDGSSADAQPADGTQQSGSTDASRPAPQASETSEDPSPRHSL